MQNIYETRERWQFGFLIVAFIIALSSIYVSNRFVKVLSEEEHNKMAIWAEAIRQLSVSEVNSDQNLNLMVLQGNKTIPVIVVDDSSTVLWKANVKLPPEHMDQDAFLLERVEDFKAKGNVIDIDLGEDMHQYVCYDESVILKQLAYYPYALLLIISLFILLAFWLLNSTKRAEQNKVWVGLSKETAHQLGTPISSLLAWMEILKSTDRIDSGLIQDMDKDVMRLQMIADRFSKIGSVPKPEPTNINTMISESLDYMRKRISSKVTILCEFGDIDRQVMMSPSLFGWVIENLCKNAIDAMEGQGTITFRTFMNGKLLIIEVTDTGKGIPKSKFKKIFHPGYTTKKRGWGLGLTLVKRIVEEYHNGKIYVKESTPNNGTTFRIELKAKTENK